MLIATNYAQQKMSADMWPIDPDYEDHPDNKVRMFARERLPRSIIESTPHKGTQIIFSDIGTPKPGESSIFMMR